MPDNIIVLDSYYEPLAAHLARTQLEAAGIACFLTNENLASLNRLYSPVTGGVRLHVYARDAARAADVLRPPTPMRAERGGAGGQHPPAAAEAVPAAAASAATTTLTQCPRCGSDNVRSAAPAGPGPAGWLTGLLERLRQQLLEQPAHHCFHCGLDF